MEEERLADKKNGHFSTSSESETEVPNIENGRESSVHRNSSASSQARASRLSARVAMRVAAFEASAATRVSVRRERKNAAIVTHEDHANLHGSEAAASTRVSVRRERKNAAFVTHADYANLHESQAINSFCVGERKSESRVIESGNYHLSYPTNAVLESSNLGSCETHGSRSIYDTQHAPTAVNSTVLLPNSSQQFLGSEDNFNAAALDGWGRVNSAEVTNTFCSGKGSTSLLGRDDNSRALIEVNIEGDMKCMGDNLAQQKSSTNQQLLPRGLPLNGATPRVLDVAPLSACSADEAAHFDLVEAHPLLLQHSCIASTIGPMHPGPNSSAWENKGQPTSTHIPFSQVPPSALIPYMPKPPFHTFARPILPITHHNYLNPRPILNSPHTFMNSRPNPTFFQPTHNPLPASTHLHHISLTQKSLTQKNSPKSKITKPISSKTTSSPSAKEIAASFSKNPSTGSCHSMPSSSSPMKNQFTKTIDLSAFPPLPLINAIRAPSSTPKVTISTPNVIMGSNELMDCDDQPLAPKSWADIVENENGVNNSNYVPNLNGDEAHVEKQSNVIFGRSMADVLKSGQPSDGPIILDHTRAKKERRGPIRGR